MKSRYRRHKSNRFKGDGPGRLFILVAIIAVAMVSARFLGFDPAGMLTSTTSILSSTSGIGTSDDPGGSEDNELEVPTASTNEPQVLIYHTHTSENYTPNPTHAKPGTTGDIVEVGRTLTQELQELGVSAIHLTSVFDESWQQAHASAAQAVRDILESNPTIQVILDVHRDAVESQVAGVATTEIGNASTARVLFTIGENDNPYLQANASLATELKDTLDGQYPGLSRGVRLLKQESNVRLHPNALEVHIGDYYDSTLDEAKATAQYIAQAVAEHLNEST